MVVIVGHVTFEHAHRARYFPRRGTFAQPFGAYVAFATTVVVVLVATAVSCFAYFTVATDNVRKNAVEHSANIQENAYVDPVERFIDYDAGVNALCKCME